MEIKSELYIDKTLKMTFSLEKRILKIFEISIIQNLFTKFIIQSE